jgi:hypothetical protein
MIQPSFHYSFFHYRGCGGLRRVLHIQVSPFLKLRIWAWGGNRYERGTILATKIEALHQVQMPYGGGPGPLARLRKWLQRIQIHKVRMAYPYLIQGVSYNASSIHPQIPWPREAPHAGL